jgi:hypothetical protein
MGRFLGTDYLNVPSTRVDGTRLLLTLRFRRYMPDSPADCTGLRITALAAVSVPTDLSTRRDRRSATDRELPPGAFPFGRPSASVRSRPVCKAPDVPCGISRCLCAAGSVRGSRPLRVISAERPTPLKNPPIFPTAFQAVASPEELAVATLLEPSAAPPAPFGSQRAYYDFSPSRCSSSRPGSQFQPRQNSAVPQSQSVLQAKQRKGFNPPPLPRHHTFHVCFVFRFYSPLHSHARWTPWSVLQDGTIVAKPRTGDHPVRPKEDSFPLRLPNPLGGRTDLLRYPRKEVEKGQAPPKPLRA